MSDFRLRSHIVVHLAFCTLCVFVTCSNVVNFVLTSLFIHVFNVAVRFLLSLAVYGHNFHNYHIIALIFSISIVQNACNHFIFSTSVLLFIIVILACPAGGRGSFVGQLPTPPPLIPGMGPASCACSIKGCISIFPFVCTLHFNHSF